jgi:phosphoribosyl 1,2-cyclic phosphate phosphodiesterase
MKVKYLGTGAAEGWPEVFCGCQHCRKARIRGGKNIRTRSSVLIDDSMMVDFPPDSYSHVISYGLDFSRLKHLVITHSHQDHFFTDDLKLRKPVFAHLEDNSILNIYGNMAVGEIMTEILNSNSDLKQYMSFRYIPPFETYIADDIRITPLLASHDRNEDCYIYIFEDKHGKRMLYGNDTGIFPDATWEYIEGYYFDLVSLDCTTGPEPEGIYHMGIPDNIKIKERMTKTGAADNATKFILTHFSHNGGLLHEQLIELVRPYEFQIAYDGFEVYV